MVLYRNAWAVPPVFEELRTLGKVSDKEMFHTFNMGIGMVLVVRDGVKMPVVRAFARSGVQAVLIGEIIPGVGGVALV